MCESTETDRVMLERWRAGDTRAGNSLLRRHEPGLRRFFAHKAAPGDVPDLVQRTLITATRRLLEPASEALRSVRAYMYGIARRVFLEHLRERRKADFDPVEDSFTALDPTLSSQLFMKRRIEWLDLAIGSLPIELHLLVEARRNGLVGSELAEMFDIPEGTVRSRMARAVELLQAMAAPISREELALEETEGEAPRA